MMPDLLMPYLVSLVTTVVVVLIATWAYFISYRSAVRNELLNKEMEESNKWVGRLETLKINVEDLQDQKDMLAIDLAEAKTTIEQATRDRDWFEKHRDEVASARVVFEQMEERNAKLADLNDQIANKTEALLKLEIDAAKAEFHRINAEEKAVALEEQAVNIAKSLEEKEQRANQAQQKIDEVQGKLDGIREEYDQVRVDLAAATKQLAESKVELESLHNELEALRATRSQQQHSLTKIRKELDEADIHKRKIQTTAKELEHQQQVLEGSVKDLLAKQEIIEPRLRDASSALKSLWEPVLESEQFPDGCMDDPKEIDSLDKVRQYLKSLDLRFDDRVINAFHTSLKISREAPLLVLAGISGTGKSLLPRRYAEAMGMHFLSVPVQPRWDGPQDLLGFFNYLDGEYKATELARALVQMDRFGPSKRDWPGVPSEWEAESSMNDRMLLVLLDEMNLARVEYYFSEFLSRLETRREIKDLDDPLATRAAEILLETGFIGKSAGVRVLPDTNMLFAGTINEDESKQTLSDMVIDRSNIMRFGRPQQLKIETTLSVEKPPSSYLPSKVWDAWIVKSRDTEKPLIKEIDNWIQELNVALGRVGRPFGFRTDKAIREYILQYPDSSEGSDEEVVRYAMADQVEQRILPKLRGLDPSDRDSATLLRTVRDVVEELNDENLASAIESGMKAHGGHLFVWHGVDRSGVEE
ncbi:MAG: hypothetical protein IH984_11910 [Planctomycetes bacterium]|nr:hypothetical protein [Planctomycetota bacterium]